MGCVQVNQNMWSTSNSQYGAGNPSSLLGHSNVRASRVGQSPNKLTSAPKGLYNLGNTCYISAVLQILFQILTDKELQIRSKSQQEITYLFFQLKKSRDKMDYQIFKKALEQRVEIVQGFDQQDAHQLLIHLLEQISRQNPLPVPRGGGKLDLTYHQKEDYETNWKRFKKQNQKLQNSKIVSLFYGQILKQFICPHYHQKHNFERYMDLSLPFTPKSSRSPYSNSYSLQGPLKVKDMLEEFLGEEPIEDLFCEVCKKKHNFTKKSVLYSSPSIMILHLSRFVKGWYSNEKNGREVEFDEVLDILQQNNKKKVQFRLIGIVHHIGSLNRGHYYANIRVGDQWYEINDQKVYKDDIKEKRNLSKTAYLLIYQKIK